MFHCVLRIGCCAIIEVIIIMQEELVPTMSLGQVVPFNRAECAGVQSLMTGGAQLVRLVCVIAWLGKLCRGMLASFAAHPLTPFEIHFTNPFAQSRLKKSGASSWTPPQLWSSKTIRPESRSYP